MRTTFDDNTQAAANCPEFTVVLERYINALNTIQQLKEHKRIRDLERDELLKDNRLLSIRVQNLEGDPEGREHV